MKWRNQAQSRNVEDMRGGSGGGMGRVLPVGGGIGTLVLATIVYFMGGDPTPILQGNPGASNSGGSISRAPNSAQGSGQNDEAKQFGSVVLKDTEDTWSKFFEQRGQRYREPKLALFTN